MNNLIANFSETQGTEKGDSNSRAPKKYIFFIHRKVLCKKVRLLMLYTLFFTFSSCTSPIVVENETVNILAGEISTVENTSKTSVNFFGSFLTFDVYISEEFSEENKLEILTLAQEYLDTDTINELKKEFETTWPPNTQIYMRNIEGEIKYTIIGSCWESNDHTEEPTNDTYIWMY